ncbi:MAG: hypothetical protein FWH05_02870 [Oscillospiraceae bacterium]|nr:hypothetical protein [Oscillospiraceae bacterium]
MKIYMDNCCYGRPFDDQTQIKVRLEATAKMYIQSLVRFKSLVLYSSFMLSHEIDKCPVKETKDYISQFVKEFSSFHVSEGKNSEVALLADEIMKTGVKYKDAIHLACSMIAGCDYMITTDKRVLKYKTDRIKIVNPIEFVKIWEESHD